MDIKAAQKAGILRLLNLNRTVDAFDDDEKSTSSATWKVLVYDKICQDILSPVITVGDLRKLGITLNLMITSPRERVPEVPAVYFVSPTRENVDMIAKDCSNALYDSFYLNFCTSLPRNLLEDMALRTLKSNSVNRVSKVVDQHNKFVSLEPHLFTMNIINSYARLGGVSEDVIVSCIDDIVESMFSVLATLGVVPIIVTRPGEAAEMVGTKLESRLREHLRSRNSLFVDSSSSNFHRPILLLVDRNIDLQVALQHTWTYQALAHDLLDLRANRVVASIEDDKGTRTKEYDLDEADNFWTENVGEAFPAVADKVSLLAKEYQQTVQSIGGSNTDDFSSSDGLNDLTQGLASAINSLPELQHQKRLVDTHTNIATVMMKTINARELDAMFALEERMTASGLFPDHATMLSRLSPDSKGTPDDKMRLLLLFYLSKKEIDSATLSELQEMAISSGCSRLALDYLRKVRMLHRIATGQHDTADSSGLLGEMGNKALDRGIGWLKGNVKNLLPLKHKVPLTRIVRDLVTGNPVKGYRYLDPRSSSGAVPPNVMSNDVIVVVCGGGSYVEMHNLREWAEDAKTTSPVRIMYGCTEMVTPENMLRQLESLAQPTDSAADDTDLT